MALDLLFDDFILISMKGRARELGRFIFLKQSQEKSNTPSNKRRARKGRAAHK